MAYCEQTDYKKDGRSAITAEGGGLFIPAGQPNRIGTSDRSLVRIWIDFNRLQLTAKTMLGTPQGPRRG